MKRLKTGLVLLAGTLCSLIHTSRLQDITRSYGILPLMTRVERMTFLTDHAFLKLMSELPSGKTISSGYYKFLEIQDLSKMTRKPRISRQNMILNLSPCQTDSFVTLF